MVKKTVALLFIFILCITMVSCAKVASKSRNYAAEDKEERGLMQKGPPTFMKVNLPPLKSFLSEAKYDLPQDKVFYTGKTVVLTYHHISLKPFSGITIRPERFEADLKMLKDNNFNVISYRDLVDGMDGKIKFPPNAVAISFDDGYESVYKYAYPALKKYNMPAISFVITSWAECYSKSDAELNQLGPDEIREMYSSGLIDIQSHTHASHDYTTRNEKGQQGGLLAYQIYDMKTGKLESEESYKSRVLNDLNTSNSIIEKYTDNKPDTLCFPFGHYNERLVELSQKAGIKYFVTTVSGYNKENCKSIYIRRIRSGDSNLDPQKLKSSIISTGRGITTTQ